MPRSRTRPYRTARRFSELEQPRARRRLPRPAPADTRARITFALIWGVLFRFLLIAGLVWLCYEARFAMVTVLISALVALMLAPVVEAMARPPVLGLSRKTRRSIAAIIVFLVLGVLLACSYVFILSPFVRDVGQLAETLTQHTRRWDEYYGQFQAWLKRLPPEAQQVFQTPDVQRLPASVYKFLTGVVVTSAQWISHIVELVLIPVLAFYLIVEDRMLRREWVGLVPGRWRRDAVAITRVCGRIMRDYIIANLILCLIAGVVVYAGLRVLEMPYALTLAIVAGVTRFVPVIGPIVGGIPIILVAAAQSLALGVGVLIFFIVLHLIESKVLLPKLIGDRLHISGALVLIVLLLGGEFAGVIGMFLAAPIAALLRVLLRTYLLHMRRHSERASVARPARRAAPRAAAAVPLAPITLPARPAEEA